MPITPVQYTPRPYVSRDLGELLQLRGQHQADAIARAGEIQAQMWGNLGNQISGAVQNYAKAKADEPYRAAQVADLKAQADERAGAVATKQAETARNTTIDGLMKTATVTDPETGLTTYDRNALQKGFAETGIGHLWPQYSELLDKSDASLKSLKDQHLTAITDVAKLVDASGNDATVFANELQRGVKNGLFTQAEAAPYLDAAQRDPSHVAKVTAAILGKKPDLITVNPGDNVIDKNNPGAGAVFTAPAAAPKAPAVGTFEDYVTRTYGQSPTPQQIEAARAKWAASDNTSSADVTKLTPQGLDMAAVNYRKTGVMPALGMGDKTTRQSIINRAAVLTPDDIAKIEAGGTDIAANKATFKSDADSLTNVTKTLDTLTAFENTAGKNLKQFTDLAAKIPDTGIPWLNKPIRALNKELLGSSDQAAAEAARTVALREIARVTNDPKLSGVLSDSARQEVLSLSKENATFAQIKHVANVLQQDMANVHTSLSEQRAAIQGRLSGGGAQPASTGPKDGDTKPIDGYPGTEQTFRGGKWIRTK